jgi:hypothetical protein
MCGRRARPLKKPRARYRPAGIADRLRGVAAYPFPMSQHSDALDGHRLDRAAVDDLLRQVGHGVLSMADDDGPYGVPLSFGYDGDRCYFAFVAESERGRKLRVAETTDRASFLVSDVGDEGWVSAMVEGPLRRVTADEWDAAREALADNAWRPELYAPRAERPEENPRVWTLVVEERGGRSVGARPDD